MQDEAPPPQPKPTPAQATRGRPATVEGRRLPGSRAMLLLFLLLVFGPALVRSVPSEISRWYAAAAAENRQAGEEERAYANLQTALEWDPEQAAFYLQRAQWRIDDGEYESALADANKAIELVGDNPPTQALQSLSLKALSLRALVLQHLGRHEEAIAVAKKIDYISRTSGEPERSTALNNLAYARALGKLELDDAQENIDEAIRLLSAVPAAEAVANSPRGRLLRAELLRQHAGWYDTRGFVLYQRGEYEKALVDLERAVTDAEESFALVEKDKEHLVQMLKKGSNFDQYLDEHKQSLAVLHYHRALAYEKLGRNGAAKKDRARVKDLIGREPDETLF